MDFIVTNHGTLVVIQPLTPEAKGWVEDNVDSAGHWPNGIPCDHRPGWGLVEVIEDAGFDVEVRHPGRRLFV